MNQALLPDVIDTERLILRPWRLEDVDDVFTYASDEEWGRYLSVPHPYVRANAVEFLARQVLQDRAVHPTWAVVLGEAVIGGINIRFFLEHCLGEMGWSIARLAWGRGLATEAARAVVEAAFSTYQDVNRIRAMADARNVASQRVMEKIGMRLEGTLRQNRITRGEPVDEAWFGILRTEWDVGRGS